MADEFPPDVQAPALADLTRSIVAALVDPINAGKLLALAQNIGLETTKDNQEFGSRMIDATWSVVEQVLTLLINNVTAPGPLGRALGNAAVKAVLGEDGGVSGAPSNIGQQLIARVSGTVGEMQPGIDGAARYMNLMLQSELDAWVRGVVAEAVSEFIPIIGGGLETFAKLQEIVEGALGGERMVRRIMQPFVQAAAITPAQWHVNKQYRPELLSAAAVIEAHLAGRFNIELLHEELGRQGFSVARINVLIENAKKRVPFADLVDLWFRGGVSRPDVIARAGALGYDVETADEMLTLAENKRRDRWKDPIIDAAVAAFINRDIEEAELRNLVEGAAPSYAEAQFIVTTTKIRRELRKRSLSSGEARRMAEKGILSVVDYRRALEREGYEPSAVTALELELRFDLQTEHDVDEARRLQAEARAKEKAAAEEERRKREAAAAARDALPSLQEYRRAYVRGIVDRGRLEAAIRREMAGIADGDLLLLLEDADAARLEYLDALDRKAEAETRRPDPALSAATLEAAVLAGHLTVPEYDARLAQLGYDNDERRLLTSLLTDRMRDLDEARRRREEAAIRAERAGVSLPDFERAVRLGLRTRGEYAAWLDTIDTPDIQRALVLDLLERQIADDDAARARREQHEREIEEAQRKAEAERDARERARLVQEAQRAIPLALYRRAVTAGVLSRDYYATQLLRAGWSASDQIVDLALLDAEMAEAAAAREKRDRIERDTEERRRQQDAERIERERQRAIKAAQNAVRVELRRNGVKAGLVRIEAYEQALIEAGWNADDRTGELSLLTRELRDAAAAEERRVQLEKDIAERRRLAKLRQDERDRIRAMPPPPPEVTLSQMEHAVVLRLIPPDELRAWLYDRGYDEEDVELIVSLAVARIPDVTEGEDIEADVEQDLAAKGVLLGDLKAAVRRGITTVDAYAADLEARGYGGGAAALMAQLLAEEVAIDFDGLRERVGKALEKTEGAPTIDEIAAAFVAGELDAEAVRDVLVMSGVPRDTALVYSRLLDATTNEAP